MARIKRPAQRIPQNPKRAKYDDYRSKWLAAVADYVKETQPKSLNLAGRKLGRQEVKSVLSFLPDSQVTALDLMGNCLTDGMTVLAPLLAKTKLRGLNIYNCWLVKNDILRLMEVLKETEITNLFALDLHFTCGGILKLNTDEARRCISHLRESKLKTFSSHKFFTMFAETQITSLVQEFLDTTIADLDLSGLESIDLASVFASLSHSSVTNLRLLHNYQVSDVMQVLSQRLIKTKIETLTLNVNELTDVALDLLAGGLVGSKVTELTLRNQQFTSLRPLFTKIKETQIKTLDLGYNKLLRDEKFLYPDGFRCSSLTSLCLNLCDLSDKQGEGLIESLKLSNVTKLDVSWNDFGLLTVKKLAENITDMNLLDLDISHNDLPLKGFLMLAECLKKSKLTSINVSDINRGAYIQRGETVKSRDLLSFLKLTEGSSVSRIEMNEYPKAWSCPPVCELSTLENTTLTELHLVRCNIKDAVSNLVCFFKFTVVSHLNLSNNEVTDVGANVLAEVLKDTEIRRLNLGHNLITSKGAKTLALTFNRTNLVYLDLNQNKIEDDGFECLAESAEDSFVTTLDVANNPGKSILLVDEVLWRNKIKVHRFVSFFQKIAPSANENEFHFNQNLVDLDVSTFLEKCMEFYKTVVAKPGAISVLLEEKSMSYSRAEICQLLFEEFPRQFSLFIACKIDRDLTEHVRILQKAEEMDLITVVESMLLHRPVFTIDKEQGVLHPYVYRLLLKYKHPVCNLGVEPHGVTKLIEYFMEHADIEGAQEVVNLLRDANIS